MAGSPIVSLLAITVNRRSAFGGGRTERNERAIVSLGGRQGRRTTRRDGVTARGVHSVLAPRRPLAGPCRGPLRSSSWGPVTTGRLMAPPPSAAGRAVRLEQVTIAYNVTEGVVAEAARTTTEASLAGRPLRPSCSRAVGDGPRLVDVGPSSAGMLLRSSCSVQDLEEHPGPRRRTDHTVAASDTRGAQGAKGDSQAGGAMSTP